MSPVKLGFEGYALIDGGAMNQVEINTLLRRPFAVIASVCFIGLAASPLCAGESIVGAWSTTKACKEIDRMDVEPMSVGGEDWYCTFQSVVRKGDTVTWRGKCGNPEPDHDAVVIARLSGGKLHMSENGVHWGPLRRCKPGTGR